MKKHRMFFQYPDLYEGQDTEIGITIKRNIVDKKICKYHTLKMGFLYAMLSLLFFSWEMYYISVGNEKVGLMLVPFAGLFICLVLGITLMLKDRRSVIENSKRNNNATEYYGESF